MRRSNATEVVVKNPAKGLMTYTPPDLEAGAASRFVVRAENVRAEFGTLRAAPGYERIHNTPTNLDSPANLIHQASIIATDAEARRMPIVGTGSKLYAMSRRSRNLVCSDCAVRFAVIGGGDRYRTTSVNYTAEVAALIRSKSVDFIVHTGNVRTDTSWFSTPESGDIYAAVKSTYREYFEDPLNPRFLVGVGPSDWGYGDSGAGTAVTLVDKWEQSFRPPNTFGSSPRHYWASKRGPVHFAFVNSYGWGPPGTGPGGLAVQGTLDLGSTVVFPLGESDVRDGASNSLLLTSDLGTSDSTWRVVVNLHPPYSTYRHPGWSSQRWDWGARGVDLVLSGYCPNYERVVTGGKTYVVMGLDGGDVQPFSHAPVTGSVARYDSGPAVLIVDADRTTFTGTLYDLSGAVQDTFSLTPQRTSTACYIVDSAKQLQSLTVSPVTARVEETRSGQVIAVAHYNDGSSEDVTALSSWSTANAEHVSVTLGKLTGIKATEDGATVAVTASFEGQSAACAVEVVGKCVKPAPADVMLCLDRSGSMSNSSGGKSRMDRLKEGCRLLLSAMDDGDRIGIVSFAGNYLTQTYDARFDARLGSAQAAVESAITALAPGGSTGIAGGVRLAVDELLGVTSNPSSQKLLVLFTDGYANVVEGGTPGDFDACLRAVTEILDGITSDPPVDGAKDLGVRVIVVGLGLGNGGDREAVVAAWASDGLYFGIDDADQLPNVFFTLLGDYCRALPPTSPVEGDSAKHWSVVVQLTSASDPDLSTPCLGESGSGIPVYGGLFHPGTIRQGPPFDRAWDNALIYRFGGYPGVSLSDFWGQPGAPLEPLVDPDRKDLISDADMLTPDLSGLACTPYEWAEGVFRSSRGDKGDNYATVWSAVFLAPASGNYTFWISGKHETKLAVQRAYPAQAEVLCSVPAAGVNEGDYVTYAAQKSVSTYLSLNERVRIQVWSKAGTT